MKLSTRGRYAVMAMADLAQHSDGNPVTLSEISDRQEISLAYLEQLFSKLRKRGLVESTRGPGGGYTLAQSSGDIAIADIVIAVDEPLSVTRCNANVAGKGCVGTGRCITHDLWADLGRHIHMYLASVSLEDVISRRLSPFPVGEPTGVEPVHAKAS